MAISQKKNPVPRPKCPLLVETLRRSKKWLFSETYVVQPEELETLENCITVLEQHQTECDCVVAYKINLFLGICHLQKFNYYSLNFLDNAESLHLKFKMEESKKLEQEEKEQPKPVNDIAKEYTNRSKFKWQNDKSASVENFKILILPALKALEEFDKFYKCHQNHVVDDLTLKQIHLFSHLNSLFQVFYYYDMLQQCHRVIDLSLGLRKTSNSKTPINKMSETSKSVPCNAAKFFLRIGALEMVRTVFYEFFTKKELDDIPLNTFQNCELFLLYVELCIRLRNVSSLTLKFKNFLKSEYLEKRTVHRYTTKCFAFITATKFNSSNFSFSPVFEEFTEAFLMNTELIKKFSRSDRFKNPVDKWDALSLRYMCFNLYVESSRIIIDFFLNTGMYSDTAYYYNSTCNFFHKTLNIFELSNVQLKLAQNDLSNGFIKDSINKMNSIENCFVWEEETRDMFLPCNASNQSTEKVIQEDDILGKLDRLTLEDKARTVFQEVRKSNKFPESVDGFFGNEQSLTELINDNMKLFAAGRLYKDLFYFVLRYTYHKILLQSKQNECNVPFHEHLSHLLDLVEVYSRKQYLLSFNGPERLSSDTIEVKFDFQVNHMQIGETFFLFAFEYAQALVNASMYEKAYSFLDNAVHISNSDYCLRIKRLELFYLHAYTAYKLAKPLYPNSSKVITLCYDDERKYICPKNLLGDDITPFDSPHGANKKQVRLVRNNRAPQARKQDRILTQQAEAEIIRHTVPKLVFDFSQPIEENDDSNDCDTFISSEDDLSEYSDILLKKCLLDYLKIEKIHSEDCFFIRDLKKDGTIVIEDLFENVLRLLMHKLLNYAGTYPPLILFEKCHLLAYKVAKMVGKANSNLLFHISHVSKSMSLRYRMLLICAKKRRHQLDVEEDIQSYKFSSSDYVPEVYWGSLPLKWRFVQLAYIQHSRKPYLLIARFQPNRSPLIIKIKSKLQPLSFFDNLLKELQDIMTGNSLSFAEIEPRSFWEMRYSLDARLGDLLTSFEKISAHVFKAMFLGFVDCEKYQTARKYFISRIRQQAALFNIKDFDNNLLELFTDSIVFLTRDEFSQGIQIVFGDCDKRFLDVCSQYCDRSFNTWIVNKSQDVLFTHAHPVGLILCDSLMNFPIESVPTGKKIHQPYFRVPSLKFAASMFKKFKDSIDNVSQKSVYYLLNPQNNLRQTEALFKERFQELKGWKGVTGKEPNTAELKKHLDSDDIYIYVGHGSGQTYYNLVGMDTFKLNPVAMVFGCSSARTVAHGKLGEVYGVQFKFLLHGSPCYVGSLWDITDKDIDAFTNDFLSGWFINYDNKRENKCPQMNRKISSSRDVCKLKHLIGGAPVIYGLPISTVQSSP